MKTHIFIATTQGLVAIQHITPIDDEDISSVVSVNGTSTTANISGSYHNFVKKGVGIIHQMFGACSYRVDISARIDQGNSWQVPMYLAHLAYSKGLLGNGEVSQGDTVICATGEINTTNHQILAVTQVAAKYKLALPRLRQWAALDVNVQFLVPQVNQSEVSENDTIVLVSTLQQAAAALPNTTVNPSSFSVKSKNSIQTQPRYIIAGSLSILVLLILFGLSHFISTDSNNHQAVANKVNSAALGSSQKTQLVAVLKQDETCAQTFSQNVSLANQVFADLALNQLCELYIQTAKSQGQLLLVARDAYTVLPVTQNPRGWEIPLPKNRLADRSYFLVTIEHPLSEEKIEQLRRYRETMPKPEMLTQSALSGWLEMHGVDGGEGVTLVIYTHKLVVD